MTFFCTSKLKNINIYKGVLLACKNMSGGRDGERPGQTRAEGSDKCGVNGLFHLVFLQNFSCNLEPLKVMD